MGIVRVEGRIICKSEDEAALVREMMPEHVRLTREEPGNIHFDATQGDDPMVWHLSESFESAEAFAAHQARTKNSDWGRASGAIERDITVREDGDGEKA